MSDNKQIPTCDLCGKQFKTNQGLGGHRALYHRLDTAREREQNSVPSLDSKQLENFLNRVTFLEARVKDLQSKIASMNTMPIGLLELVVCPKCGMVLELDKIFRKSSWLEEDNFECPRCGSLVEVIELISRKRINAKEYAKIPEHK